MDLRSYAATEVAEHAGCDLCRPNDGRGGVEHDDGATRTKRRAAGQPDHVSGARR